MCPLQESCKEPEVAEPPPPAPAKSTKQRAPKPPAPQPPVAAAATAVSATPASISISPSPVPPSSSSSAVAGWERSQSTLPSVGNTLDEMFSSSLLSKPTNKAASAEKEKEKEKVEEGSAASPTFSQVSRFTSERLDWLASA